MSKFTIAGIECEVGDIIECLNIPFANHAERYHIVLEDGETRDLGNNNSNMWCFWTPIKNLGHYSQHPDLFDQDDREYYFGNDEHKRNAKIISEAIAQMEKDPEGMALAFLNNYLDSKVKRVTPDWIVGPLDEVERIAKENGIDVKDLNITPVSKLEEE